MAENIPLNYQGQPLYQIVYIGGERHFAHTVFGLHDDRWFFEHGISPNAQGVPVHIENDPQKGPVMVLDDQFAQGERLEKEKSIKLQSQIQKKVAVCYN